MAINIYGTTKEEDMTLKQFENYVNSSEFEDQLETAIHDSNDDNNNYKITIHHECSTNVDSVWGGELIIYGIDKRKWRVFTTNIEAFREKHKKDLSAFKHIFENALKEISSKGTKKYKYNIKCNLVDEEQFGKTIKTISDNSASITYQLFVNKPITTM